MKNKKNVYLYFAVIAFAALALGLSFNVFSNFFKDVYTIDAQQRGFIELPREFPGVIAVFVITFLAFLGDLRIAMIGNIVCAIAILTLAIFTPAFNPMLVVLFLFSMGMHLFQPLSNSIGLKLFEDKNIGKNMGLLKSVNTAFLMIAAGIVFIGFRSGLFSFTTNVKIPFLLASVCYLIAAILLFILIKNNKEAKEDRKLEWVFRKEYKYFYMLTIMNGVQKQIMFVFGPWVLIDLLSKKADVISMLFLIASFVGIFFMPFLGKLIDKYGVKKLLYADALSFIFVYLAYGFLSAGFANGTFNTATILAVFLAYSLIILDKMSMQMAIIRVIYLKGILVKETDLTKTITMGMSLDHIVTIIFAMIGGVVWKKFGPQYIFYGVATLSLVNLYVAIKVNKQKEITKQSVS